MPTINHAVFQAGSFDSGAAVTPNDSADLSNVADALYVGGAGNVVVRLAGDGANSVTITGVPAGAVLPLMVRRVLATGTTATAIVALRAGVSP